MGSLESLIVIGILLVSVGLGGGLAAIVIHDLVKRWLGRGPAPSSSSVAPHAPRGFRLLDPVLLIAAISVAALALVIDARFGSDALKKMASDSMYDHYDAETFWYSARALLEGRNIYDTGHPAVSSNAPLLTVLIAPLGLLEPLAAYRVFVPIMLLITVGYLAWTADELRLRGAWAVVGTGMLIFSTPLLTVLVLGQIYLILALGLVAAWIADRRGATLDAG